MGKKTILTTRGERSGPLLARVPVDAAVKCGWFDAQAEVRSGGRVLGWRATASFLRGQRAIRGCGVGERSELSPARACPGQRAAPRPVLARAGWTVSKRTRASDGPIATAVADSCTERVSAWIEPARFLHRALVTFRLRSDRAPRDVQAQRRFQNSRSLLIPAPGASARSTIGCVSSAARLSRSGCVPVAWADRHGRCHLHATARRRDARAVGNRCAPKAVLPVDARWGLRGRQLAQRAGGRSACQARQSEGLPRLAGSAATAPYPSRLWGMGQVGLPIGDRSVPARRSDRSGHFF